MSASCLSARHARYPDDNDSTFRGGTPSPQKSYSRAGASTNTADAKYYCRLEAAEALALVSAASMRRSTVEAAPRSMVEDRLSLEAAAALTDVAHMQGRRRREDAKQFIAHDVAMYDVPPPPPALGPPNSSPPTPEAHRHFSAGSPGCQQNRGKYRCGRCGQMKVNHVCPIGRAPLQRSLSVQTEPIYLASSLETGAVLTSRPRTPRDRVLTVRRWDVRKRSLCDAAC